MEHCTALLVLLGGAVACSASTTETADTAEEMLCPELAGTADPMGLSYSSDAGANGRIRAFVSTTRGLYDATLEMERTASEACLRIRSELGYSEAKSGISLEAACEPLASKLAELAKSGIEVRVSVAPPRCNPSADRQMQCGSACPHGSAPECEIVCQAQGALYAACTLPAVSVATSSDLDHVRKFASALERHLPNLFYAQMALGKRLAEHGKALVSIAGRLPKDLSNAGPHGIACVTLATGSAGKSLAHLESILSVSEKTTAALDPELHPTEARAP